MQKRIVLVDDNVASLTISKAILSPYYNTIPVTKWGQLFKLMEKFIPDIILLDIEMPEKNGFEIFESIRELGINIPIIFLSGNNDDEYIKKALDLGAADYICKPFNPGDLLKKVAKALDIC